jgi:hypothetical protein
MSPAFRDAAIRHWRDAELLEEKERFSNADHLFGFAAECALKVALSSVIGVAKEEDLTGRYRKHIDELWDRVRLHDLQKRFPHLCAYLSSGNRFSDWSVDQRYADDGVVTPDARKNHKLAAKRLLGMVMTGERKGGS